MVEGKVAIISSNAQVAGMLRGPFEAANFQVEEASSGEAGLMLCRQFLPHVVLVDADLQDMNGLDVCRSLRAAARTGHIHIIILAHSVDRQLRLEGLKIGADDFIVVPFDPDEVRLRVRNALRRAAADNLTDPVTGLPSGRLIQARLRELVGKEDGWALLGLTVRYLEPFKEVYGFLAAQEVLRSVARLLASGVDQWGRPEDFIGHSGMGRFVVVTGSECARSLAEGLVNRFEKESQTHYSFREREQGYLVVRGKEGEQRVPLMRLEVRQVLPSDGPFYDIRSLTEALG